ncbi:flagellar basal-body MS-ring/collar protein FliF [Hydrogenothermus marinus]|uniref:Flagellar M-ring protein n=1 Tax=Hydrogenothermus marinus TaxID=133270 RepID=A0A3M0BJY9_9AQUI|nr:flagellar basal-body MS-ring/collar protein FliF [Hydrogenothermus marinus]RMA97487.1 flagellar M-ring protein FliF [Hydrogenothermus marinus]
MASPLDNIKGKLPESLQKYLEAKYIAIGLIGLAILSILGFIIFSTSSKQDYAVLYTNLSPEDAGQVLTVLQEEKIPYKVEGNGSIILVPKDKVYDVRLKLAAKGIPSGSTVGFEIFKEPKMGITQFQENVNYLRALEGELERTINQLDPVIASKVNIALPKESIFAREEDQPKASILVKLFPGKDLTPEQVKAIVFLVSRSVPKLKPENVTVVDNRGRVLSDLIEQDETAKADKTVQLKTKLEKQIERNIQSMLSHALGYGKVVVRATVELETGNLKQKDEIYDPDKTAVVSERRIKEEKKVKEKKDYGPPGTSTNVPPIMDLGENNNILESKKEDRTRNYDVSKSIIAKTQPIFKIKKISVGVLIDGKYQEVKDKNGNITYKFIPRSPEEIKQYEELVKSAIGYDPKRGDKVTVVSVPFEMKPQATIAESKPLSLKEIIIIASLAIVILTLLLLILAIFLKSKKAKTPAPSLGAEGIGYGGPQAEALAAVSAAKEMEEINIDKDPDYIKLLKIADENPEIIATLIRSWLKEQ